MYLAGIEAGGTKFICGISDTNYNIIAKQTVTTTTPDETMIQVINFFKLHGLNNILAIGLSSFGPIIVDENNPDYGTITSTPKIAWRNFRFLDYLKKYFSCPIKIETDVNGAAYGEFKLGNGVGTKNLVYFTVGTGIGAGIIQNGQLAKASEVGHIILRKHPNDTYNGMCPSHKDNCLEGLASGPAISNRWNVVSAKVLEHNHIAWEYEAYYLAQAAIAVNAILAPERIIFGGGVMWQTHLYAQIRQLMVELDNGYFLTKEQIHSIDKFIMPPGIDGIAGLMGSFLLAHDIYARSTTHATT